MTGPSLPMDEELFETNANACGTEKNSNHGYHRFYPIFLSQLDQRDRKKRSVNNRDQKQGQIHIKSPATSGALKKGGKPQKN
jgi:hypothetical protein